MTPTPNLQAILKSVEALTEEEQNTLYDLIHQRHLSQHHQTIAKRSAAVTTSIKNGTAKIGTVDDLIADLLIGSHDEVYR